jgi:hypothetical protein
VSDDEDLDLLALQRQLDDAFQTTRPRPAFEDELWLRMQARRPVWQRLRDGLAAVVGGIREAPTVPSAAVAILLIVLLGAGIFTLSGLHPSGGASSLATGTSQDGGRSLQPNAMPAFGRLPAPVAAPKGSSSGTPPPYTQYGTSGPNVYFGPAALTWVGHLEVTATNLPVFRYNEPTPAAADQFAASVGAAPSGQVAPGGLGMYSGQNFTLVVTGSAVQPAHEPSFNLSDLKSLAASSGGDPVAVATAYLAAHSLIPTWPYQTEVQTNGATVRVRFLRSFELLAQGQAGLVDSAGERYGIEVDTAAGVSGAFETGPLPLSLDSVNYSIVNSNQAVQSALASSATTAGVTPLPAVRLTNAELVYTLAYAGDHSFYEPAFLFSGTFTVRGSTYVKRILVPAVVPSFLSP